MSLNLSRDTVAVLVDLIQNRLAAKHVGDCEDFQEMVALRQGLEALQALCLEREMPGRAGTASRRGRRPKVSTMLGSMLVSTRCDGERVAAAH